LYPNLAAQQITETSRTVGYTISDTADYYGNRYISYWGQHPHVLTFINSDGSVTVCASDTSTTNSSKGGTVIIPNNEATTYIYEYDMNLREQKTITVKNEFDNLGAFTKDDTAIIIFSSRKKQAIKTKKIRLWLNTTVKEIK